MVRATQDLANRKKTTTPWNLERKSILTHICSMIRTWNYK